MILAHLLWDPPSDLFVIPYLNHPVKIYGALFALGFLCGYFIIRKSIEKYLLYNGSSPEEALLSSRKLSDRITWMSVVGAVVGARLGHMLFYDLHIILKDPSKLFFTWEGGLASHGGAIALLIVIALFWLMSKKELKNITFLRWFDLFVVPVALVAVFIRIGNFFNQEILGTYTTMPWGLVFGHAMDQMAPLPRHPVPLYEAACYLATFLILKFNPPKRDGATVGLFFILVFGSRFVIEFWKSSQHGIFDDTSLQTGQLLSLPFILTGFYLLFRSNQKEQSIHRERPQSASDQH